MIHCTSTYPMHLIVLSICTVPVENKVINQTSNSTEGRNALTSYKQGHKENKAQQQCRRDPQEPCPL